MPGLGYDEQGSLATYFVLTFLSLVLIPSTLWSFKASISSEPTLSLPAPVALGLGDEDDVQADDVAFVQKNLLVKPGTKS